MAGPVVDYDGTSQGVERPTGVHQAVLSNVVDVGERPDPFHPGKKKRQVILVWQLNETLEIEGKQVRFQQTEFAGLTLNAKSKLRRFVEGMLGKTIEELYQQAKAKGNDKFRLDLEKLIGFNCMLTISKKDGKEESYTYVESVAPLMKGLTKLTPDKSPIPAWIEKYIADSQDETGTGDASTDINMEDVMSDI